MEPRSPRFEAILTTTRTRVVLVDRRHRRAAMKLRMADVEELRALCENLLEKMRYKAC